MTRRRGILRVAAAAAPVLLAGTSRRVREAGAPQPLQKADAIVVFGAGVWPTGPSLSLEVRVARAAEVYAEGWAPVILCSGGFSGGVSEAATMRRLLIERGIPAHVVIPDDGGTTTRNALRSALAFGDRRWRRIIAVSSPYHMHRIRCEAARQGLDVVLCPAVRSGPATPELRAFDRQQHQRETMAVVAYAWRARLATIRARCPRVLRAAARQVMGRARYLAGGADAVAHTSDEVTDLIKAASNLASDAQTSLTPAAAGLAWPVNDTITSAFGLRHRRLHAGVDIRAAYGCPVRAAAAGVVIAVRPFAAYGNVTLLDHGSGLATLYAHQAGIVVDEGAAVRRGQVIGYVGTTGASAPHLHFEVRVHGSPVDPTAYLS